MISNIPVVKLGIVAVSRDCFPIDLSRERRAAFVSEYRKLGGEITELTTTIENEDHVVEALEEIKKTEVNALISLANLVSRIIGKELKNVKPLQDLFDFRPRRI